MAISTPTLLGTNTGSGVTSVAITTGAPAPAGDTIIVCTDGDLRPSPGRASSVTDSAGNTYTAVFGNYFAGQNIIFSIWAASGITALASGGTITVNYTAGTSDFSATAFTVTGLDLGNPLDQSAARSETPSAVISLTTGQLGLANELALVYWVSRQAQGAPGITADWNSLAAFQGAASTHWDNIAYKIVSTADPVIATASTPSAGTGWAGALVTFRATFKPTATLHCGGTVTGFPVTTVPATATLHCGGSILTGDELGPVAPPVAPVFPAGYGPVTQDFENWIRQSLGYCTNQTVFRAEQAVGGGQALTANTWNALAYDTILEDPWGGWSAVSTANQAAYSWLVPWTGLYRVTFRWPTVAGSAWQDAALGVSGANPAYEAGGPLSPSGVTGGGGASFLAPLIGGADYVQMLASPSVSATTDTTTLGRRPSVEITSVQTDLQG